MAEAVVENRPMPVRFFCHKCNIEFDHVLQDYTCPFCSGGFIERLEDNPINESSHDHVTRSTTGTRGSSTSADESSEVDMTTLEEAEEFLLDPPQFGNDLTFLMYNNQLSPLNFSGSESRLLQMVQQLTGAMTGGSSPLLVVGGSPGDYVLSGEGLDAVMSQLLWQAESEGPPPLGSEAIAQLPEVSITEEQEKQNLQCSVCWEAFIKDEKVRELSCGHLYHQPCIAPWLSLHATCPICRKSLAPPAPDGPRAATPIAELLTAPPGLALLFRACGVPFPQASTSSTTTTTSTTSTSTASTAQPAASNVNANMASPTLTTQTPPTASSSLTWPVGAPNSRFMQPVAGVLSLLRAISQPNSSNNTNQNTEQRSRPPAPNYDMDLDFD